MQTYKRVPREPCCDAFARAFESASDSEEWGLLFRFDSYYVCVGCGNAPVMFCPFCGKAVVSEFDKFEKIPY